MRIRFICEGWKRISGYKRKKYYELKSMLISGNIVEWFFLSGEYGIIHALEAARKYQATFNRNVAYQKGILYTANPWRDVLPAICDSIVLKFNPDWIYVFGSETTLTLLNQPIFGKIALT